MIAIRYLYKLYKALMGKLLHRWIQKIDGGFERVSISQEDCLKIEGIWSVLKKLGIKSTHIDRLSLTHHVKYLHNNNVTVKSRKVKLRY